MLQKNIYFIRHFYFLLNLIITILVKSIVIVSVSSHVTTAIVTDRLDLWNLAIIDWLIEKYVMVEFRCKDPKTPPSPLALITSCCRIKPCSQTSFSNQILKPCFPIDFHIGTSIDWGFHQLSLSNNKKTPLHFSSIWWLFSTSRTIEDSGLSFVL